MPNVFLKVRIKLLGGITIMSSNCTDKQKSAALYVAHQLGTILFGYKMMTDTSGADTIDESRLESVSATVKAKEDTVIGGSLTYANSMLAIARKYVDFAKDVKGTKGISEYKNAIVSAYITIAEKILDMAESFAEIETITADKLLIQVPVLETPLETSSLAMYNSGTINVSVYKYGNVDISNGTLTLLNKNGTVMAAAVDFTCKAGETTVVNLSYNRGLKSQLQSYTKGSYTQYYATAVVKEDGNEVKNTLIPLNADAGDGLFKE